MQTGQITQDDGETDELAPGTSLLHGQYIVERYLVRGGFGVTYLARDSLERRVVIKECFPATICHRRHGQVAARLRDQARQFDAICRHFLREARRLARLSHPHIVGVHQVFEENGTAYMALDYLDGIDLLTVIEEEPERLTPALIHDLMMQALKAVRYIHGKDILHRDISPDNFLLDWDNHLTLIDFGAAREHMTKAHRALSALLAVKDGYSPQEFYLSGVSQTQASDLYALGATFYHVITGEAPPHSQDRLAAIAADAADPYLPLAGRIDGFGLTFLQMIDKALEVFPENRVQSANDWLNAIETDEPSREDATEPAIADTISQLVEDTNRNIEQGRPGDARMRPASLRPVRGPMTAREMAGAAVERGTPVDIFGNPIHDVEAWLKEQERAQSGAAQAAADADAPALQARQPGRSRFLKSLIHRFSASPAQARPRRTV